jgi:hypothetical protein
MIIAEFELGGLDRKAPAALDKAAPIGTAVKLAVGHDLKAHLFLQTHHVANGLVEDFGELGSVKIALRVLAERRA